MNSKLKSNLFSIFIFGCLIFVFSLGGWLIEKTYHLWAYGVEHEIKIIKYERSNYHVKSSATYTYLVDLEGKLSPKDFCCKLEEGGVYTVLSYESDDKIILGKKKNIHGTFVAYMGGYVSAYMVLGMYLFFILTTPSLLKELWQKRNTMFK